MSPFHEVETNFWGRTVRETRLNKGDVVSFRGLEVQILNDNRAKIVRKWWGPGRVEIGDGQSLLARIFEPRERVTAMAKIVKRESIFVDGQTRSPRRVEWRKK